VKETGEAGTTFIIELTLYQDADGMSISGQSFSAKGAAIVADKMAADHQPCPPF